MLQKRRTVIQLDPPHINRINASERAIRTFKNNFFEGFASVDTNFPIYM